MRVRNTKQKLYKNKACHANRVEKKLLLCNWPEIFSSAEKWFLKEGLASHGDDHHHCKLVPNLTWKIITTVVVESLQPAAQLWVCHVFAQAVRLDHWATTPAKIMCEMVLYIYKTCYNKHCSEATENFYMSMTCMCTAAWRSIEPVDVKC